MAANDQIKAFIDRVIRLKEEQDELSSDIRDVYAEAKAMGYDKTAMGEVVAYLRKVEKKGKDAIAERGAIFDLYLDAYERPSHAHAREDGEVNAKLIATVATGMQTEIGRKALVAALDIMIEREEAEEQVPAPEQSGGNGSRDHQHAHSRQTDGAKHGGQDGEPAGADHASHLPETANETMGGTGDDCSFGNRGVWPPQGGASSSRGNDSLSVVTGGESAATSSDHSSEGGADEVDGSAPRAGIVPTSNTGEGAANTALPAKSKLRPNCLQPELCRSGTRDHCYSCRKAMEREDAV